MKVKSNSKLLGWLFKKINITPYDGYLYFKFEINPHYRKGQDMLNKVHFKILAYCFVSRLVWNGEYRADAIDAIKKANLTFGYGMVNRLGQLLHKNTDVGIDKIKQINGFNNYISGCFNLSGDYVGDIRFCWFFVRQGYVSDRKYAGVFFHQQKQQYYGSTANMGGAGFAIHDKEFQPEWRPTPGEIEWEWVAKYCKAKGIKTRYMTMQRFLEIVDMEQFVAFIPYKKRGESFIGHLGQARLSAKRLIEYLSK